MARIHPRIGGPRPLAAIISLLSVFYLIFFASTVAAAPSKSRTDLTRRLLGNGNAEDILHSDCSTFDASNPPFPGAVCRNITKPDGTPSVILLNNFREDPEKPSFRRSGFLGAHDKGGGGDDDNGSSPDQTISVASEPPTKWIPGRGADQSFCNVEQTVYSPKTKGPGSPLANDCLALQQWARANAGHWIVSEADLAATAKTDDNGDDDDDDDDGNGDGDDSVSSPWVPLALVDTCVVAFKTRGDEDGAGGTRERSRRGQEWGVAVGNADLRDLVWESVAKAQSGGRVQVLGNTRCVSWTNDGSGHQDVPVDWWLRGSDMFTGDGSDSEPEQDME